MNPHIPKQIFGLLVFWLISCYQAQVHSEVSMIMKQRQTLDSVASGLKTSIVKLHQSHLDSSCLSSREHHCKLFKYFS